ncbi:MAG: hypothetical protein ACRDSN_12295, partial [Pseudonocardiaceae bacterium]
MTHGFHIEDSMPFERSNRVSVEHGHANKRSDGYSAVVYWSNGAFCDGEHRDVGLELAQPHAHPRCP